MHQMQQYHDLIEYILECGEDIYNERTQTLCKTIIGSQMTFDMSKGFPALTTRKLPFRSIVGELLGFFRGYTSAKDFRELNCNFWNANANETKAWLSNPYRKEEDDCGNIYGHQWNKWLVTRVAQNEQEYNYLIKENWKLIGLTGKGYNKGEGYRIFQKEINQLEDVVRKILTNPTDRRIIVSGWNIGEFDMMSLPPCHMDYRFTPIESTKTLHVVMTIRSLDVFLGTPANIASTALFLEIVAKMTGYTAGKVVIQGNNCHLYENSFEAAKELISRRHFNSPMLTLGESIRKIESIDEIYGCFSRIEPDDIKLLGYSSHGVLTVPMVA